MYQFSSHCSEGRKVADVVVAGVLRVFRLVVEAFREVETRKAAGCLPRAFSLRRVGLVALVTVVSTSSSSSSSPIVN